jgi:hypothetical protein
MSIPAANQILTSKDQLQISFTSAFQYVNNSDGSGIEDVSWWRPLPAAGFYPLGDLTHPGFGDANGVGVVATVKGLQAGVLQPPTGFTKVGTFECDRINHLWFWRPTPPPGYVSLGLVVGSPGDTPPPLDVVMCIREDLVVPSAIGDMVWGGHGDESLARLWGTKTQPSPPGEAYFNPGTFVGVNDESLNAPKSDPSAYALQIDVTETPPSNPLPRPKLQSYDGPPPDASDTVEYIVEVPWFTVVDPQLTALQQLTTSPRYRLVRTDRYHLLYSIYNEAPRDMPITRTYSWGTDATASHEFSETTGISFTLGYGGGLLDSGPSFSCTLTQSFTVTDTSTQGWQQQQTSEYGPIVCPGNTAIAIYTIASTYTLMRESGEVIAIPVPYTAGGDGVSLYITTYPDPIGAPN